MSRYGNYTKNLELLVFKPPIERADFLRKHIRYLNKMYKQFDSKERASEHGVKIRNIEMFARIEYRDIKRKEFYDKKIEQWYISKG